MSKKNFQTESIEVDLTKVDRAELAELRRKLQETITTGEFGRQIGKIKDKVASHSSHNDTDGWV